MSILLKIFGFVFFYLVYSRILCSYKYYYFCFFFTKIHCYTLNQTCLVTCIWRNFIRDALRNTFLNSPPLSSPQNEPATPPKKASGADKIPTKFVKLVSDFLSTPLAIAINHSFASSKFSYIAKVTTVIPIDKKTDKKYYIQYLTFDLYIIKLLLESLWKHYKM